MNIHAHRRCRQVAYAVTLSFIIFVASSVLGALPNQGGWLITPEEAAMKPAAPDTDADTALGGTMSEIGREMMNLGPIVEVKKPGTGKTVGSPVEIIITFKERLAPINLESLDVILDKWININITDRVRPYVSEMGIHIPDATLPPGNHTIIVYIEDVKENPTEVNVIMSVD